MFMLVLFVLCLGLLHGTAAVTVTASVGNIAGHVAQHYIDGKHLSSVNFLGIPYAESTAGVNRFRKPVPKAPFTSLFHADRTGPECLQANKPASSEDCLQLNVYVPGSTINPHSNCSVMVWIHGGGFQAGSSKLYIGDGLASYGNVIVVVINYRLNVFGFLSTGTSEAPGNYELWDQHLALKWVNTNIASFGGNPNEVTIFGESAGGSAVIYQAMYPGNKGLFQRVIAESGTAFSYWAFSNSSNAHHVLSTSGCSHVSCLQTKSHSQIQHAAAGQIYYLPIVDNDFLHEIPTEILEGNNTVSQNARDFYASLDIMTGVNNVEGYLFVEDNIAAALHITDPTHLSISKHTFDTAVIPGVVNTHFAYYHHLTPSQKKAVDSAVIAKYSNTTDHTAIRQEMIRLTTDALFYAPAMRTAQDHVRLAAKTNKATYFYMFTVKPLHHAIPHTPSWVQGTAHADEIQFVFGMPFTRASLAERKLSKAVIMTWTNFAKSGNPNHPVDVTRDIHTTWPTLRATSPGYMEFSTHMSIASARDSSLQLGDQFWMHDIPALLQITGGINPAIVG